MKKNKNTLHKLIWTFVFVLGILLIFWGISYLNKPVEVPKGSMILIEYTNMVGLSNFVNEMEQRDVSGLLMVSPDFVVGNCEEIKEVLKHGVEIIPSYVAEPFWDMSYERQKELILNMTETVEACTGEPVRMISSRYMASDLTTVEVAEELGIPYITARGTTDTKATVYQPEGYNVKILSVSNIPLVTFKYGSLCDYSFFERSGSADDMLGELNRALEPLSEKEKARYGEVARITPVSHTRIGGYLKPWMDMWIEFWDNSEVEWVDMDGLMAEVDWTMPLWQIPLNKNSPYTSDKMKQTVSYEDEEKVDNPCAVVDLGGESSVPVEEDKLVMFHNGKGPMCIEALEWIDTIDYPVEQHLTDESDFYDLLSSYKADSGFSEGVSDSFGYYPMIFVEGKAYSGFNEEISEEIEILIN